VLDGRAVPSAEASFQSHIRNHIQECYCVQGGISVDGTNAPLSAFMKDDVEAWRTGFGG
jgi:hypothetical protein